MKRAALHRLETLERLRKLKQDQERLRLSTALRATRQAYEACNEAAAQLESMSRMRFRSVQDSTPLDITRYELLGECMQADYDEQDRLLGIHAASEEGTKHAASEVTEAWKNHTAVMRTHERRRSRFRREQESRELDEGLDIWIARREW